MFVANISLTAMFRVPFYVLILLGFTKKIKNNVKYF